MSVTERILKERLSFIEKNAFNPTHLYIGQDDFYDLRAESEPILFVPINPKQFHFYGMQVFIVKDRHHIAAWGSRP